MNKFDINILTELLLSNNFLDYDLYESWDIIYQKEDIFICLDRLSNSNNYISLITLAYIIENMNLDFIKRHRVFFMSIIRNAVKNNCERANIYFFKECINIIDNKYEFNLFVDMIYNSKGMCQNEAISLLRHIDRNLMMDYFHCEEFTYFFENIETFDDLKVAECVKKMNNLSKKIYFTGMNKNGVDKLYIIKKFLEYNDYELSDYIFMYLDSFDNSK